MSQRPPDTGMYVFVIRYRKILTTACIFLLLLGVPVSIYDMPIFDAAHKYEDAGFLLGNIAMYIVMPVCWLIYINKAKKAYQNEEEWKKLT